MFQLFKPDKYYSRYDKIHFDELRDKKLIIFDLDNTLVAHDVFAPPTEIVEFIKCVKDLGFMVVIASNNKKARVSKFCKELQVDSYHFSLKPFPFVFSKIKKKYQVAKQEMILVGDQLLTDILGAKIFGIDCILVNQIVKKDITYTKVNRKLETIIFNRLEKSGFIKGKYDD